MFYMHEASVVLSSINFPSKSTNAVICYMEGIKFSQKKTEFTQKLGKKIPWLFHDFWWNSMISKLTRALVKTMLTEMLPWLNVLMLETMFPIETFLLFNHQLKTIWGQIWNSMTFPWPKQILLISMTFTGLAPVVQKLDSAIHRINLYPVDKC